MIASLRPLSAIFLAGMLIMAYNVYMTVRQKDAVAEDNAAVQAA